MYGFPQILNDAGMYNPGAPLMSDPSILYTLPKGRRTFYTVKDGNWSDTTIWATVDGAGAGLPTVNDDVYIRNVVTFNVGNATTTINSLYVSNRLNFTSSVNNSTLFIFGSFIVNPNALVDCSGSGTNSGIYLYSNNNFCNKNCFIPSTASLTVFAYSGNLEQDILDLNYHNLTISGIGTKTLRVNTVLNGNLVVGSNPFVLTTILELSSYDFTVNGTSTIGNGAGASTAGILKKSGSGTIIFVGGITVANSNNVGIDFNGNPNVEVRGGIALTNFNTGNNNTFASNFGTGTWSFTTNNQSITDSNNNSKLFFNGKVVISTITLSTNAAVGFYNGVRFNDEVSGTGTLRPLGNVFITNITYPEITCSLDLSVSTSSIIYTFDGNYILPRTVYTGLGIRGTGTKTLSGNTVVNTLNVGKNTAILDTLNYNLEILSTCNLLDPDLTPVGGLHTCNIKQNIGNIIFGGDVVLGNGNTFALECTNSNITFKNGITGTNVTTGVFSLNTSYVEFTTNNQSISFNNSVVRTYTFFSGINIIGAITLNVVRTSNSYTFQVNQITGNNASSTLVINNNTINYQGSTQPMATGILNTSTNLNTFIYGNGNQDVKGGTYRNLTLNGGGTKTLQGNVSVQNTYTLTSPATLNNNGFTLTNP